MKLDLTNLTQISEKQAIAEIHKFIAFPSIIIVYITALIILGLCGFMVEGSKKKFIRIWFIFAAFFALACITIIIFPNITQWFSDIFKLN